MRSSSKFIWAIGLGSVLLSGAAMAKPFSYNYVEGGIADVEDDDNNDADYMFAGGSLALDPQQQILLRASASNLDYDNNVELDAISIGVGHPISLSERSDVLMALDYSMAETDSPNPVLDGIDVDTLTASATSRTWLTNNIEGNLMVGLAHQETDRDDDTGAEIGAGVRLYIIPQFSVAANISRSFVGDLDRDLLGLSARLQF
ncbi:Outer membrane protein beta-barrel domain [Spongiibacter sp. IMCC21906]|uniref:hypothetical protein n=1 Tax=Spongiibacter sp. IMCC21906 TaxID=1620392 RepID=UPI00062DDF93|nr:hypothetical protein [Spongiibacter sp. IMCC21906]AKH68531.1 Outer membrane protein beta-barrel domain [Spongiibacter sp. IMCC21906]